MNTVILYGSKYGCTENCAKLLKEKLIGNVDLINLKSVKDLVLTKYDKVIIGGSIYIGRIRKEVRNFCDKYKNELLQKELGLFIVGMTPDGNYQTELTMNFPKELLEKAKVKEFFGGEFVFKKMNFMERFLVKKITKVTSDQSKILTENINKFAMQMN